MIIFWPDQDSSSVFTQPRSFPVLTKKRKLAPLLELPLWAAPIYPDIYLQISHLRKRLAPITPHHDVINYTYIHQLQGFL